MNLSFSFLPWVVLAVVVFWAVGAHNRLVRLRAAVLKAYGAVHSQFEDMVVMLTTYGGAQPADAGMGRSMPARPTPPTLPVPKHEAMDGVRRGAEAAEGDSAQMDAPQVVGFPSAGSPSELNPLPRDASTALTQPDAALQSAEPARGRRRNQRRRKAGAGTPQPALAWVATSGTARSAAPRSPGARMADTTGVLPGDANGGGASATLLAAAAQFSASLAAARLRPLDREVIATLATARDVLFATWQGLLQGAHEAGVQVLPDVQLLWNRHLLQTDQATRQFNEAVDRYNQAVAQFPAAMLAWLLRLRKARTL